jgi:hypothetical protein
MLRWCGRRPALCGTRLAANGVVGVLVLVVALVACTSDPPPGAGAPPTSVTLPPAPDPVPTVTAFEATPDLDHYRGLVTALLEGRAGPSLTEDGCVPEAIAQAIGFERFDAGRTDPDLVGRAPFGAAVAVDPAERGALRSELAAAVAGCEQLGRHVSQELEGTYPLADVAVHRPCLRRSWSEGIAELVLAAFADLDPGLTADDRSFTEVLVDCPDAFVETLVVDYSYPELWSGAPDEACIRSRVTSLLRDPEEVRAIESLDASIWSAIRDCDT